MINKHKIHKEIEIKASEKRKRKADVTHEHKSEEMDVSFVENENPPEMDWTQSDEISNYLVEDDDVTGVDSPLIDFGFHLTVATAKLNFTPACNSKHTKVRKDKHTISQGGISKKKKVFSFLNLLRKGKRKP